MIDWKEGEAMPFPDKSSTAWPWGCRDTASCGDRNRACMYLHCIHSGRDISAEIDAEIARLQS